MDNSAIPQTTQPAPRGGIEPADVSFKGVVYFLIGMVITAVLIHLGLIYMFVNLQAQGRQMDRRSIEEHELPAVAASHTFFPQPREQISPRLDLEALRAREEAELNSYGWVDRKAGVVRIPIERAMELLLQKGLPGNTNAGNRGPSSLQLQQERPNQSSPPSKEEGR